MRTRLSKSQFLRGLQCHKSLWLYRHRKDLIPEPPAALQLIFDQGHEIGKLAWKRFPGGRSIEADHLHPQEALRQTQAAITAGAQTLYEAAAVFEDVLIRADVLVREAPDGPWDLFEVKGSTDLKETHLDDVAIQRYVLEGSGFYIRRSWVVLVNNQYVRRGEIDAREFFTLTDVTLETESRMKAIPNQLRELQAMTGRKEAPDIEIGAQCSNPYECEFIDHCWKHVPDYSIFNLTGATMTKKAELWHGAEKYGKLLAVTRSHSAYLCRSIERQRMRDRGRNRSDHEKQSYLLHMNGARRRHTQVYSP